MLREDQHADVPKDRINKGAEKRVCQVIQSVKQVLDNKQILI